MIARTLQITGGGAGLAALSGSLPPWGVVLLGVLGAVVAILALLMPQQSPDRLEWWRALFRFLERLRRTRQVRCTDEVQ